MSTNCWRCKDGAAPCAEGVPHHNCSYPIAGSMEISEGEILATLKSHLRLYQLFKLDGSYDKTIIKPESLIETARAILALVADAARSQ